MYSPVVAENERLKAEVGRLTASHRLATPEDLAEFDAQFPPLSREGMERLRKRIAEHVPAKRRLPDGTLEKTREELVAENQRYRAALKRISGASVSMHTSMADLAGFMKRTATEVLRNGSTQENAS
ncbi:hypothetical protein MKX34_24105 [Paenibacillus sp. FSL R5-0636]|uniref:hypothetical protein n=1 Tax=Paenibacillus TaxID=44249 RepID=UPI00117ECBD1|nr:hypothetical protein [Paenibacillus odorifer]